MEHHISKAKYEGYLWRSDSPTPEVIDGSAETEITLIDEDNPFVVEGQLWDKVQNRSIAIRYAGGHYCIAETTVTPEQFQEPTVCYIAHRMAGIKGLKFLRIWTEQNSKYCEDMPVMTLQNTVFVGFEK